MKKTIMNCLLFGALVGYGISDPMPSEAQPAQKQEQVQTTTIEEHFSQNDALNTLERLVTTQNVTMVTLEQGSSVEYINGLVLNDQGYVIVPSQTLAGKKPTVVDSEGNSYKAKVVKQDFERGLALLKTGYKNDNVRVPKLAQERLQQGETASAYSRMLYVEKDTLKRLVAGSDVEQRFTSETVSQHSRRRGYDIMQGNPNNYVAKGSIVVNKNGELLGMVRDSKDGIKAVIPAKEIFNFLDAPSKRYSQHRNKRYI